MKYYQYRFKAMGTPCEIQLYAKKKAQSKQAINKVVNDVRRLESLYSRYRQNSYLSKINRVAAVSGSIEVDGETAGLLNYAYACYQQSDGLFDITSGLLRKAWSFEDSQLPDENHIQTLLTKIGWDKLNWSAPVLEFLIPGMEIDFGGIVKEYAVDRAAVLCQDSDIQHGIINLGGDIRIIGSHPDGHPWNVGIRHPHQQSNVIETLLLHKGALASSGDYERCITLNGIRYGHILNPKTGWPVRHLAAVSVVSDLCVVAGSASTIAMLKEKEGAMWLESLELPYLWVDVSGESSGLVWP